MNKKIFASTLALTLCTAIFTACGNADGNGVANGQTAKKTAAVVATEEEAALAAEFLERSPVYEDVVTEGVVNEYIKLLKEKYAFEKYDKILVSGDYDTYTALGKGWYDALFADSGIKVEIQQSVDDNEPSLMERGELTFANRMLYPYLLDKKNDPDNKLIAVWNSDNPPKEIIAVVVKSDSEYKSFADLKGCKIASSAAGCPYSALMEQAQHNGWEKGKDFEHINTKEYTNALLAGEVDAIVYHPDKQVSPILLSGEAKIIDTALEGGIYEGGGGDRILFAPTDFVKNDPNITKGYVELMKVVGAYLVHNPEDAAAVREEIDRTPSESSVYWIEHATGSYYTNPRSLDELKDNARGFSEWLIDVDDNFSEPANVENGYFAEEYFN